MNIYVLKSRAYPLYSVLVAPYKSYHERKMISKVLKHACTYTHNKLNKETLKTCETRIYIILYGHDAAPQNSYIY